MLGVLTKLSERRRAARQAYPRLRVRIDGRRYHASDWSLGGLRIDGFRGQLRRLERVAGTVAIPGGPKGPFVAEVMWQREDRVGLRFLEVAPGVFFELSALRGPHG